MSPSTRSFLDRAKGVNVTIPESTHKHSNIFPVTDTETWETGQVPPLREVGADKLS